MIKTGRHSYHNWSLAVVTKLQCDKRRRQPKIEDADLPQGFEVNQSSKSKNLSFGFSHNSLGPNRGKALSSLWGINQKGIRYVSLNQDMD